MKTFFFFFFFLGGGGDQVGGGRGWGSQGGCEQSFCENKKKNGWAGWGGGGVRVDVNEELKFL